MTGIDEAVVVVILTQVAHGARWTCACEVVDQIMADATVLTHVGCTVINVNLTVQALE